MLICVASTFVSSRNFYTCIKIRSSSDDTETATSSTISTETGVFPERPLMTVRVMTGGTPPFMEAECSYILRLTSTVAR